MLPNYQFVYKLIHMLSRVEPSPRPCPFSAHKDHVKVYDDSQGILFDFIATTHVHDFCRRLTCRGLSPPFFLSAKLVTAALLSLQDRGVDP